VQRSSDSLLWAIRYAAILHDIGKFAQRGRNVRVSHEELGADFVDSLTGIPKEVSRDVLKLLVLNHHMDDALRLPPELRRAGLVVAKGDSLSASERQERAADVSEIYKTPLLSIFGGLHKPGKEPFAGSGFYSITSLQLTREALFPKSSLKEVYGEYAANLQPHYDVCWKAFCEDFTRIGRYVTDPEAYFDTLYYCLQKHTFFVPSAVATATPDISLFEHLRVSSAIADALSQSVLHGSESDTSAMDEIAKRYLLVGGDISGIQDFIYTISSKGALKGLKGRSLYVSLLNEAIAKHMLDAADAPISGLIFCAGGHFLLLASSAGDNQRRLAEARRCINSYLLHEHGGDLYAAIEWLEVSGEDLRNISVLWNRITQALNEAKSRKFSEKGETIPEIVLMPPSRGGNQPVCDICQRETDEPENNGIRKCRSCTRFEETGTQLNRAKYLVELRYTGSQPVETSFDFPSLGLAFDLADTPQMIKTTLDQLSQSGRLVNAVVYSLNTTDFLQDELLATSPRKTPVSFGFRFIARSAPIEEGDVKSLDLLAKEATGINRVGIAKMDIDDLGLLVTEGLGENKTLSRFSTFSALLDLFFSGYVEVICQNPEICDKVYVIYSGGDDLLLVGSWDRVFDLATRIRQEFQAFALSNPSVTLSCACMMAPAKYPVYQMASSTTDRLEEAKTIKGKDSIWILGRPFQWARMQDIMQMRDLLREAIETKKLPKSILQDLTEIQREYNRAKGGIGGFGRYRWMFKYMMARYRERYKEDVALLEKIEQEAVSYIDLLEVPLRWTEFLTREKEMR